ncbi:SubName: Full=Uncharacterized protein {ECO:0000313/EMBL:CCA75109.1} [Serendipita indica DSM 11827]|nr:SubName: Full=Uncharacterized protein {ECO:0000313/EMBL:CCA75109.1} [Serendipita indica DSM 11827]
MSAAKYANLPDIDTAQDVYETADPEALTQTRDAGSDDESKQKTAAEGPSTEELDPSSLLSAKEAHKVFRKAEKRRARAVYSYPRGSDESSDSDSVPPTLRSRGKHSSQFERLLAIKQELAALEAELSRPGGASSPPEGSVTSPTRKKAANGKSKANEDPTELLKGVHDVRVRLERIGSGKDNRERLLEAVVNGNIKRPASPPHSHTLSHSHTNILGNPLSPQLHSPGLHRREGSLHRREGSFSGSQNVGAKEEVDPGITKLDSRVGELERLVGSGSAALDETTPLPPPLLPMLTRLNTQLTILTQPRTIDSISRRLKLLLTDMDRVVAQNPAAASTAQGGGANKGTGAAGSGATTSAIQEQITPILQRLAPHLPTLPHILARLKTLSTLHAAAADFQRGVEQLEAQQARNRSSLNDLDAAVKALEKSMQDNAEVEKGNVSKLEANVQQLLQRLERLEHP